VRIRAAIPLKKHCFLFLKLPARLAIAETLCGMLHKDFNHFQRSVNIGISAHDCRIYVAGIHYPKPLKASPNSPKYNIPANTVYGNALTITLLQRTTSLLRNPHPLPDLDTFVATNFQRNEKQL
jgi:hypothetical protein